VEKLFPIQPAAATYLHHVGVGEGLQRHAHVSKQRLVLLPIRVYDVGGGRVPVL
jgi:hypothetical protein